MTTVLVASAALLGLAACSGETEPRTPDELLAALRALPGVHDATEMPTQSAGYHYYVLHFEQPVG